MLDRCTPPARLVAALVVLALATGTPLTAAAQHQAPNWNAVPPYPMSPPATAPSHPKVIVGQRPVVDAPPDRNDPLARSCDELADHPADPHRVGTGVAFAQIDVGRALTACASAAAARPARPRYQYLYGRVLHAAQRFGEAARQYDMADQGGFVLAAFARAMLMPMVSVAAAADRPPEDRWHEHTEVDKITDSKMVYLTRVADNEVFKLGNLVERNWPRLAGGCQDRGAFFGVMLTNPPRLDSATGASVTTRHGTFKPVTLTWRTAAGSEKGLFVADRTAINVAAGLTRVDKLLLRYTSKEGSDVTLEFTMFGVKDHLPRIARACGWDYARALREWH
jgi:hypothetical protein